MFIFVANGISADFYHAGRPFELRDKKQTSWTGGEIRVIVATNAFGMGIDKAEVRFVGRIMFLISVSTISFQNTGFL